MDNELFVTNSEEETIELGKRFAERLTHGDVVAFYGGLGAGKTEFVKGVCDYFQVDDIVSSPTFTIINQYEGIDVNDDTVKLYHIDLYRVNSQDEFDNIGFDECMHSQDAIKLVEWSEKANGHIPTSRYSVRFTIDDDNENKRNIEIERVAQETLDNIPL